MRLSKLHPALLKYLKSHGLENKFGKQTRILLINPRHPSLNTERLEPKHLKIYSFRIDRKYRAIFVVKEDEIIIVDVNDHYQR